MSKKIIEQIQNKKYNKYVFKLDDGTIIIINAADKLEAINMLSKGLKNNLFEKHDFEVFTVHAEIKKDGTSIIYDSDEE
ncbi:hypothetical protein JK636_18670 [Clostridium sp. YIM B02515]|uniref:Uncharacterized protein n=1 Tax=Clostridium rhizosphaerae TaxID=2803861 RepID=A0ABS1TG34_9CLOT|nr:hypothetical protein [Clostridium rhizosphaerae]MBL4937732.1 hypothetical protein [Clostridium rhizosphaerae]